MPNGFVTSSPVAKYGSGYSYYLQVNDVLAQKFTAGGSGVQNITEIGMYLQAVSGSGNVRFAIFTHDAGNNCPASIVANSDTGNIAVSGDAKYSFSYSTKPQVTGGVVYWLVIAVNLQVYWDYKSGVSIRDDYVSGVVTYPTWPTAGQWQAGDFTNTTIDSGLYAVYAAAAAAFAPMLSRSWSGTPLCARNVSERSING